MSVATAARWPVFPVHSPTEAGGCSCGNAQCATPAKHPRIAGWQAAATTDAAQLAQWARQWPGANSGIPTGEASGLVVVDNDPRHGGDESIAELEREYRVLPQTPRQITGSGGTHYFFAHPGGDLRIPNRQNLRPGVDIRGDGGYVVAPGSRHASGGVYEWDAGAHPDDVPLAALPEWLLTELVGPATSSEALPEGSRGVPLRVGQKALDFIRDGAPIGSQRGAAVAAARNLLAAGESVDETADLLRQGLQASPQEQGRAPWTYDDARAIAIDIAKSPPPPLAERMNGHKPADAAPERSDFPYTDTGNAERFAARYGDQVRYDHKRRRWLVWGRHWWQSDADAEVRRMAKATARGILREAANVADDAQRKRAGKWAIDSESRTRLDAMLDLAQAERPIADAGDNWDADPWLLGVANGVVDLKTGELRDGRQDDRITMHSGVAYDPEAECPRWLQFQEEIFAGDAEVIDFVHRAIGYSATGDTSEQVLFLNNGRGGNGKGVQQTLCREALGPYSYNTPFSTIEMKGRQSQTFDLADLAGRRFVTASETNESARLNEARVKALTGEDPITARHAYQNFETYAPVLKLWLSVNHLPQVDDDSFAFWRRVRLIPFTKRFEGQSRDPKLKDKLRAELPGILAWIVRGCLAWQARGLAPPSQVQAATERYREDSDVLSAFIADRCIVGADVSVAAGAVYREYQEWAKAEGIKDREQLTATVFGKRMGERFERRHGKAGRVYFGIALADNAQRTFDGESVKTEPENGAATGADKPEGEGSVVSEVKGLGASRKLFLESSHGENFTKQGKTLHPLHPEDACGHCGQPCDYFDAEGNPWCELHGPGREVRP